jgi:hypothetical protein
MLCLEGIFSSVCYRNLNHALFSSILNPLFLPSTNYFTVSFQDENNNLLFRYDSTPHFPNLSTFPHHKHLPNDVISCQKPEITQVLKEATELLRNN